MALFPHGEGHRAAEVRGAHLGVCRLSFAAP
jgi:hypothetical protein